MRVLQFFRYIVYLNVIVSLSTGILSAGYAHMIGLHHTYGYYGVFAFLSTFAVYNGQRLFKIREAKTNWMIWVRENAKTIGRITLIALGLAFLCFLILLPYYGNFNAVYLLLLSSVISVFYVMKVRKINLREIPYIKIHLIAITWVIVLVVLPSLRYEITNYGTFLLLCLSHYFYVLAVTIPFDIRDLKYDMPSQKTIPQLLGIQGAKVLALVLLLVFVVGVLYVGVPLADNWLFYFAVIVQALLILGMQPHRSDLYCAGGIDGAIALLGLAYFFY